MASSPQSSREGSPAPLMTPRSKLRALLATVESSDEEGTGPRSGSKKTTPSSNNTIRATSLDNDSESDVPVRPRGKLASRMQASSKPTEEQGDARERVKKLFQREQEEKEARETADAEKDDEEEPVVARRLKRRVRDSTPENDTNDTANTPASPGLFVESPEKPSPSKQLHQSDQSDSENELPVTKSDRFKALVEKKRQERLAREAAEEAQRDERLARQERLASEMDQFDSDGQHGSDDEGGRRLTQEVRPTRKASKKAIEEMNRETQRIARNMQLAHEAKTRKKISKATLFEKFNFKPAGQAAADLPAAANSSSRPSTPNRSDVEMGDAETPPTSPPSASKPKEQSEQATAQQEQATTMDVDVLAAPTAQDKGKGVQVFEPEQIKEARRVRVRLPYSHKTFANADSDDELQITTTAKDKIDAIFNSVPQKKAVTSNSLQVLHAFTTATSPDRTSRSKDKKGMTAGELTANLQRKAREQAKRERDRRMETLKAQGIVVETAEERERQMEEVEDLVTKARQEAERLMEKERDEAKANKKADASVDPLAWDDSDEDYEDSANEADAEASAIELSGSEDEENEEEDDDEEEGEEGEEEDEDAEEDAPGVVEAEAAESDDEEEGPRVKRRRARTTTVLSDDEDVAVEATPRPKTTTQVSPMANESPAAPGSVLRSAKKTFIPGLPVQGPAGLGLTQIFAGTMDSQMSPSGAPPTQSMMPDFDHLPDSNFSATIDNDVVQNTQPEDTQEATQAIQINMTQSQMRGLDSLMREELTQGSQVIELSQDGGLREYTPLRDRFVDPPFSTVDTVVNDEHASPLVRKRLRQKVAPVEEEQPVQEQPKLTEELTAFAAMKDRARQEERRRLAEEFDRKKSKAKEMVQEQAEESEDEYAGLGGADGEDSDSDAASVQDMIDDNATGNADAGKLAAFYADRERADDEKAVEKLFKDITTGMLRRKRGADYDLDDSDDDGEARRRMKRRQFAKMQKALFSDERVKKMASDPGNKAFLRTIEDQGSDDEVSLLVVDEPESQSSESASQEPQVVPDSQPKPLSTADNRPPARMRRTTSGKKPSNIGEVRETLSNLLEEPQGSVIPATEAGSDSEGEEDVIRSDKENQAPRVVDRISLKRTISNISTGSSSSTRVAFAATSSTAFKVPMLLRRATTNSSLMSTSSSDVGSAGGFGEDTKIKKAASKRSGVVSRVREVEGQAKLQESERRREERKIKGAEKRRGVVGGLLGRGSFA